MNITGKAFVSEPEPEFWDGFGFFVDVVDDMVKFYFFDDMVRAYGPSKKDPAIPADRETFHVLLTTVRKAIIHIEEPFTSNFTDPFTYAKHIAHAGFSGLMIRKTQFSENVLKKSLEEMMRIHALGKGFMYKTNGVEVFYKGILG